MAVAEDTARPLTEAQHELLERIHVALLAKVKRYCRDHRLRYDDASGVMGSDVHSLAVAWAVDETRVAITKRVVRRGAEIQHLYAYIERTFRRKIAAGIIKFDERRSVVESVQLPGGKTVRAEASALRQIGTRPTDDDPEPKYEVADRLIHAIKTASYEPIATDHLLMRELQEEIMFACQTDRLKMKIVALRKAGLRYREVAWRLGITVAEVKSQLGEVYTILKRRLDELA